MKESCYGCRFALESRAHRREGEQVKCAKAGELFGGERWVNVRKGKKGQYLKSNCGEFQAFQGDDSTAPDPSKKARIKRRCGKCQGAGRLHVTFIDKQESMKCYECKGAGNIGNG